MKAKKLYPDKSIKRIWNKIKDLEKNGTGSGGSGSGSTNGTVLVLLANNWVEQSDGTFTNTIPMSEFTSNMMVEIDLYNDGSLTETQITEYNSYISKFNINDGEIVAVATTQPTQTMSIICRGDFSISEDIKVGNLSQVIEQLDELNSNLGEDVNGMTLHEKLDEILNGKIDFGNENLLWERSPSNFAAQTISLDLSEYTFISVVARASMAHGEDVSLPQLLKIGESGRLSASTAATSFLRSVSCDVTGVTFGAGYWETTLDNGYCIPVKIYGYK